MAEDAGNDLSRGERWVARRLNRRDFMRGAGGAAAFAGLVLAGCSSNNNSSNKNTASNSAGSATKPPAAASAPAASGATSAAAGASPAAAAATSAPVVLKGSKVSFLGGTYFVPAGEDFFKQTLSDWGKQNGVETSYDATNWPDLQPKIAANIQSGSGPDVMQFFWFWPALYADNLVDVTDIASELEQRWGGFTDAAKTLAFVNGKYMGVPEGTATNAFAYRISYLKKAGFDTFPDTWDDLFKAGKELKKQGKPIGQALGHSLGDPISFVYPYMYSNGGQEISTDLKSPGFNNQQFIDALQKFVQAWKDGFDETGLSWDDSSNNKAFLADQIAVTNNGSSIYLAALKDNPDLAKDMNHAINPQGPTGRWGNYGGNNIAIMKYSKNQAAAKEFVKYFYSDAVFLKWLQAQQGYQVAPTKTKFLDDPMYTSDPKLKAYLDNAKFGRFPGFAAPPGPAPARSMSDYIIVDMYAKAVQNGNAKQAVQDAADQIKKTYSL